MNIEISRSDRQPTCSYYTEIERISCEVVSYDVFHEKYFCPNACVVISNIAQNWDSTRTWITTNKTNIDLDFLKFRIPNHKVPIADCTMLHLNSHKKIEMNFHDFLDYWKNRIDICDENLWYLKDWHLRKYLPTYDFYETPHYFGSDWLNEHLSGRDQDDYKFVYMGPKGTWTPLHSDVFSSYSWSTNIFGRKKWMIIAPKEEQKLMDDFNNLPFSITEDLLLERDCNYFSVIQNAGETFFVPTGWYHQVENLEDTISINHNFFNGCNVSSVWSALLESYRKVLKEIEDCKDMDNFEEHCQVMLKALHGMNFEGFLDLLEIVVSNRIKCLRSRNQLPINGFVFGRNLCIFDLKAVKKVLNEIENSIESLAIFELHLKNVCSRLKTILDNEVQEQINGKRF